MREADYTRPETLSTALHGVKRVLLISAAEVDQRFKLHKAVIDAAKEAGVELFVYTSLLRADSSEMFLARAGSIAGSGLAIIHSSDVERNAKESEYLWLSVQHRHG